MSPQPPFAHVRHRSENGPWLGTFGADWLLQVHVKSMSAHAVRSLIIARKKLVGQRVTMDNQIRGLAVVFGIRLPQALTVAFLEQALQMSDGIDGLSAATRGLVAAREAVLKAVLAIDGRSPRRSCPGTCRRDRESCRPPAWPAACRRGDELTVGRFAGVAKVSTRAIPAVQFRR
jgi:hypothetical protein